MQDSRFRSFLLLHLVVFIAGFTAILGKLITIESIPLVWYRMGIATLLMFVYAKYKKIPLRVKKDSLKKLAFAGLLIALHWILFFESIKQANISIALALFSTAAFFGAILEPIIYKRKIDFSEVVMGCLVVIGVSFVVQQQLQEGYGVVLGLLSAFFAAWFSIINGKLVAIHNATTISVYEFTVGILCITLYLGFQGSLFEVALYKVPLLDWVWLFLLGSICTAFAFIISVAVMKDISPYTVILSYNLEPVYGILLAILLFPETEIMGSNFYIGVALILLAIVLNTLLKRRRATKERATKEHI